MHTSYGLPSPIARPGYACLVLPLLGTCHTLVAAISTGSRSRCPTAEGSDGQAVMLMLESKAPCAASSLPCACQLAQARSSRQSMAVGSKAYEEPQRSSACCRASPSLGLWRRVPGVSNAIPHGGI